MRIFFAMEPWYCISRLYFLLFCSPFLIKIHGFFMLITYSIAFKIYFIYSALIAAGETFILESCFKTHPTQEALVRCPGYHLIY
jgi:hypothetical protein